MDIVLFVFNLDFRQKLLLKDTNPMNICRTCREELSRLSCLNLKSALVGAMLQKIPGGGALPYLGYTGTGYGFLASLS